MHHNHALIVIDILFEVNNIPAGDYQIGVGGFSTHFGAYHIKVLCENETVNNDTCAHFAGATTHANDIDYYNISLSQQTSLIIDACDSQYDTWLDFAHANGTNIHDCDDCGPCGLQTVLEIHNVPAGIYRIGVGGWSTSFGTYRINVYCTSAVADSCSLGTGFGVPGIAAYVHGDPHFVCNKPMIYQETNKSMYMTYFLYLENFQWRISFIYGSKH